MPCPLRQRFHAAPVDGPVLKALVAGWFSFREGHATAGDVPAGEVACDWLEAGGFEVDLAMVEPVGRGCDWRSVDASSYSHVVFVCGPFQRGELNEFLSASRAAP